MARSESQPRMGERGPVLKLRRRSVIASHNRMKVETDLANGALTMMCVSSRSGTSSGASELDDEDCFFFDRRRK
jgi:hypothetical protein